MKPHLFINGRFLSGGTTAVNSVSEELTRALASAPGDWSISLAVPPTLADKARDLGLPVRVVGRRAGIAWEQIELPALRREGVVAGFFNTVPLRGRGYVSLLHDAHVFLTPKSFARSTRLWRQLLSRRAGASGNLVLTISDYSKRTLLDAGIADADRIGVVPLGLGEVGRVVPSGDMLERSGLAPGRYCVALSNLMAHKNIPLLLKAFADPRLSNLKLVLIGKARREDFEAAGHAVPSNVVFPGFVSDAELAALYGEALAVCMPSTEEGFGLPALEGMAHGAPVIVAPCGALPEVVGDAGVLASADDPEAWIREILHLAGNEAEAAERRRRGRDRAAQFTWASAARRMLDHLDRWRAQGLLR